MLFTVLVMVVVVESVVVIVVTVVALGFVAVVMMTLLLLLLLWVCDGDRVSGGGFAGSVGDSGGISVGGAGGDRL